MINLKMFMLLLSVICALAGYVFISSLIKEISELKQENSELINTKELQEAVIKASNENQEKNNNLKINLDKKTIAIKSENDIKTEKDFIEKSRCIYSNFDNENECK